MDKTLEKSRNLISEGQVEEAITLLKQYLTHAVVGKDEVLYLLGNAYRKQGNWQEAIQYYSEAMELNPEGPASEAHRMMIDIMEFYNKDMFNQ